MRALRIHVVRSKTLVFIWVLVFSYGFVRIGVVGVLMDYLSKLFKNNLRKAAIVGNVEDGLSSILVVVTHVAESYAGRFNVIVLCTAASVIGLMFLWISLETSLPQGIFYVGLILIALGDAMDSTLKDFLEYQLEEKVKVEQSAEADTTNNSRSSKRDEDEVNYVCIWWYSALVIGSLLGSACLGDLQDSTKFKIAALIMGATYFWFYFGCFSYSYEELSGSPLYQVYRVFMAALWKLIKPGYPTSVGGYYSKNPNRKDFYTKRRRQIRLTPDVPFPWRWLDKAAIIEDQSSPELQEAKGELCSVEEVREVKYVASLANFGVIFVPCSLVKAAGSTFFIEQMSNLDAKISLLLLLKFCVRELVTVLCWWLKVNRELNIIIVRISVGMFLAVLCCFAAYLVELYRLSEMSVSVAIMVPQYVLLGLTEGLALKGFKKFFCNHVPESMWSLEEAYTGFLVGVGKLLTVPFIYFITGWFKDSINKSHIYRYYLTLGFLNIAALLVFGFYSWNYAYKARRTREMEPISGQSHRGEEPVDAAEDTVPEGPDDATGAGASTVASEEQPLGRVMQQTNRGTRPISRSSSAIRRDQQL